MRQVEMSVDFPPRKSAFDDPIRYATGVRHLFVNGIAVVEGGESKAALPGRAIRLGKR
jgi:N-acyl-D-amino-acid deacylase